MTIEQVFKLWCVTPDDLEFIQLMMFRGFQRMPSQHIEAHVVIVDKLYISGGVIQRAR